MSSAQFHLRPQTEHDEPLDGLDDAQAPAPVFALKQQVAERLAEHRARRKGSAARPAPTPIAAPANSRAARIAATVAERYAHSQSYRAFLAAEAQNAISQAEAAAEVAARTAQAVADAQLSLLAELDQWNLTPPPVSYEVVTPLDAPDLAVEAAVVEPTPHTAAEYQHYAGGLTIRLYDEGAPPISHESLAAAHVAAVFDPMDEEEQQVLDDEIEFRQAPVFDDAAGSPIDIPANLIEFPRQLVAARRARPRIAEGPLRDDAGQPADSAQLRIFEVEPAQISTAPAMESTAPVWSSIVLDALPSEQAGTGRFTAPDAAADPQAFVAPTFLPDAASIELRLMAALVDGCIVAAGWLAFVATFALIAGQVPIGPISLQNLAFQNAIAGSAIAFAGLAALYQFLFFTFSDTTPGMRYARIALCTFSDDNPTRSAMRRRALTLALSASPLGIGLLWAWFDGDRLSWHDRISRIYQRSY